MRERWPGASSADDSSWVSAPAPVSEGKEPSHLADRRTVSRRVLPTVRTTVGRVRE